ncbi:hypothetical protein I302_102760 [Kwoniella bestiolae CBS 10118]|uniref:Uncharacterized protein n=1 Tax=Kwoniella bestiolae CBS 10118 TaxID=1296100 RepID=A0A1B9GFV4_9TREE|nr:hypothetical protein I302_01453 [Kwoniella bestiolae CBS 10118]OCF29940.1 hypothetical protein I302_01453 [Kwoniella bestiolae CBS 10118]
MQNRPPAHSGPSTEYHPPLPPSIPLSAINTLIPRLTTTINDIDSLRNLIGSGYNDGTLPSWDTLLQRYSLLLGRINALTTYLSPPTQPNRPPTIPLAGYLIHPLNPIPSSSSTNEVSPLAQETFLQAINTQLLPSLADSTSNSSQTDPGGHVSSSTKTSYHSIEELRRLDERSLELLKRELRSRLNKENLKIEVIKREISRREEEVDWTMRIDEGEDNEDDEGEGEGGGGEGNKEGKGEEEEEEDDLFGGDEEDEPMVIDVDAHAEKAAVPPPSTSNKEKEGEEGEKKEDGQGGWKVEDYLRFMDSGKLPEPTT